MLTIDRHFTKDLTKDPYESTEWEERTAKITGAGGNIVFEQEKVKVPKAWSATATNIVASKYFYGKKGSAIRETGVDQLIKRVVNTITDSGIKQGYFNKDNAKVFNDELAFLLINQYGAFNSPVWFNVGCHLYEPECKASHWHWDFSTNKVIKENSGYYTPQCAACFINSVDDSMESIMELATTEAMLFKGGSGSGTNFSSLRSNKETLSGGGHSSGPLSFMKGLDAFSGVIKSGGKTRRAAKMAILNIDHPNIIDFIDCKLLEDKKAQALMREGYDGTSGPDSEAYASVFYQNANNSVRVTDQFMYAIEKDLNFSTLMVKDRSEYETFKARDLQRKMSTAAWSCGDPGLQFDDTINYWHTCKNSGRINSSNPCQPKFAPVLTPNGISTIGEVEVGDVIWSGFNWTHIKRKIPTGIKSVSKYKTTAGSFIGTKEHKVLSNGSKLEVQFAESIDINSCIYIPSEEDVLEIQTIVDGLVLGDGTAKISNKKEDGSYDYYPLLCVGNNDQSYFDSEVKDYINDKPFDGKFYRVVTTLLEEELPLTYNRKIPDRFYKGNAITIRSFLRGLYSANGSLCGGRVTLKASSFTVIEQVQQMLSVLGIKSYYTKNIGKEIDFSNGTYLCKDSYDLNITKDRKKFYNLIGFIQPYKSNKLVEYSNTDVNSRNKVSYSIIEVEDLGELEVFDIEVVSEEHTYWTGGLLVSNCSEYMFLDNSACNLASLNLIKFLKDNSFDIASFNKAVSLFIIAQDILVDMSGYPTEKIAKNSHDFRPLGLGYANLGALLMALGLPYDSEEGRAYAAVITALMTGEAYNISAHLSFSLESLYPSNEDYSQFYGSFPGYDYNKESFLDVIKLHLRSLDSLDEREIADKNFSDLLKVAYSNCRSAYLQGSKYGYRNSQTTVLAPTGTIGFMMDCDTTGIEPELALVKFKRLVGGGQLKIVNETVDAALCILGYDRDTQKAMIEYIDNNGSLENCKLLNKRHLSVFDTAFRPVNGTRSIHYMGHIKMMAACQPFLSGAISKTVNLPNEATVEDIEEAYMQAWKLGLKSIAVYRDGSKSNQVLVTSNSKEATKNVTLSPKETIEQLKDETSIEELIKTIENIYDVDLSELLSLEVTLEQDLEAPPTSTRHKLPDTRNAINHKFSIVGHEGYLNVGLYGNGQPGEIFITMAKEGSTMSGLMDSFALVFSISLQHGVPLESLVSKLEHTRFEPSGWTNNPDVGYAKSIMDYIARWLRKEFLEPQQLPLIIESREDNLLGTNKSLSIDKINYLEAMIIDDTPTCTECGALMVRSGACHTCTACGATGGCG